MLRCFLFILAVFILESQPFCQEKDSVPQGFKRLLKRNQIPAIHQPIFVHAESAKISEEAWIFGIVIDGEAKAYSLNLLNFHEIVNDQTKDVAFATVW